MRVSACRSAPTARGSCLICECRLTPYPSNCYLLKRIHSHHEGTKVHEVRRIENGRSRMVSKHFQFSIIHFQFFIHRLRFGAGRVFVDIAPDVDDGALPAGDAFAGFFQSWTNLAGLAHGDAPAAEAFGEFFAVDVAQLITHTATLRTVLADLAAADLIHRRVVADHSHIRELKALRGFHIPSGHAEGAVTVVTQHFFLRMD